MMNIVLNSSIKMNYKEFSEKNSNLLLVLIKLNLIEIWIKHFFNLFLEKR